MRRWLLLLAACAQGPVDEPGTAAAGQLAGEVVAAELMPWVDALTAAHLADAKLSCDGFTPEDRYPICELSRDAAVPLVRDALAALGYQPEVVVLGGGEPAYTVIAEQPGTTRPEEVVLVGAHLDAFYGGADDNGSGVAVLLETARVVRSHRFARTVRFVAFDLEEHGSAGSARYVEAGLADDAVAVVVLDAVGFASSAPDSQDPVPGLRLGSVADFLAVVGNADSAPLLQRVLAANHRLGLVPLTGVLSGGDGDFPLAGSLMRSDHAPFWQAGIPALLLSDTANFRNPHYHRASDLPETLDPVFLAAVTRLVVATVGLAAEVEP